MAYSDLYSYLDSCKKPPVTENTENAKEFLSWAIEQGYYSSGIPEEPTVVLSETNLLIQLVFQAYKSDSKNESIPIILKKFMELEKISVELEDTNTTVVEEPVEDELSRLTRVSHSPNVVEQEDKQNEKEIAEEKTAKQRTVSENLDTKLNNIIDIYKESISDAPIFPHDLTQLSDIELRQLYSSCTQYYVYNAWLATLEENKCVLSETASKARMTLVMNSLEQIGADKKAKTSIRLKEEASNDVEYRRLNAELVQNKIVFRSLKSIAETYKTICDHISREWTMRTDRDKINK